MLCYTGETFTSALLAGEFSATFFNEQGVPTTSHYTTGQPQTYIPNSGELKSPPPDGLNSLADLIREYKELEDEEMQMIVALMKRCLRLDPANRPTADELLLDPWWKGVE
jgi:serine/threonine protein kinase